MHWGTNSLGPEKTCVHNLYPGLLFSWEFAQPLATPPPGP